jgi:hypothetical protein
MADSAGQDRRHQPTSHRGRNAVVRVPFWIADHLVSLKRGRPAPWAPGRAASSASLPPVRGAPASCETKPNLKVARLAKLAPPNMLRAQRIGAKKRQPTRIPRARPYMRLERTRIRLAYQPWLREAGGSFSTESQATRVGGGRTSSHPGSSRFEASLRPPYIQNAGLPHIRASWFSR